MNEIITSRHISEWEVSREMSAPNSLGALCSLSRPLAQLEGVSSNRFFEILARWNAILKRDHAFLA